MNSINKKITLGIAFAFIVGVFCAVPSLTSAQSCDNNPECFPPVTGVCVASVSRADIGETVTFRTSVSGGNGFYSFSWSGTDNLAGNGPSVLKSYNSEGVKTATVEITSYGRTITRSCDVIINEEDDEEEDEDLRARCEGNPSRGEVGERIRWTVDVDGGDGDYEYDWDGDDNLRGDDRSVTHEYDTPGRKDAEVEVESGNDRVTARCDIDIDEEDEDNEIVLIEDTFTEGGIYLNNVPATGISLGLKTTLFLSGIFIWSAFLGYLYIARRNEKMQERTVLESIEG